MNLEKMSLKEIYAKYGLSDPFNKEVIRRYAKRKNMFDLGLRDEKELASFWTIQDLEEIFNSLEKTIEYLLNTLKIDFLELTDILSNIPDNIYQKYLTKDYSWLRKNKIMQKVNPKQLVKLLIDDKKLFNYPVLNIPDQVIPLINEYLLNQNIKPDEALKILDASYSFSNNHKFSYEVCKKYLDQDYSWLKNKEILRNIDPQYLLEILLIDGKLNDYPGGSLSFLDVKITNDFLLKNDIEKDIFIKFLKLYHTSYQEISEEVCLKYLANDYDWLKNMDIVKNINSNYLLKVLLIEKQIINYSSFNYSFIDSKKIDAFLLKNDIKPDAILKFLSLAYQNYYVISPEILEKQLGHNCSWLYNRNIINMVNSEYVLKKLLIDKEIINYPDFNPFWIDDRLTHQFLLENDLPQEVVNIFLPKYAHIYSLSKELCAKYLTQDYNWLNEENMVKKVNNDFLLKVLLIDKQLLNYPNINISFIDWQRVEKVLLDNNIDQFVVLTLLNNNLNKNISYNIYTKYLEKDTKWLNYPNIIKIVSKDYLEDYFLKNQDIILNNKEYKNRFFKYEGMITSKIIEDSLVKNDYDSLIEAIKSEERLAWLLPPNQDLTEEKAKRKALIIYKEYNNLKYDKLEFKTFVINNYEQINENNVKYIIKIIYKIRLSNSSELRRVSNEIISIIINSKNAFSKIERIENVFLKNNIPFVGKAYAVFDILYPDKMDIEFFSPMLENWQGFYREIIIFADLIKASFGSNNRSVRDYLKGIEEGNILFNKISKGEVSYEKLSNDDKLILKNFCNHLITLYQKTSKGQKEEVINLANLEDTLSVLKEKFSFNGHLDYDLSDRIVKMFCHFAGINTLSEAKAYMEKRVQKADARNRQRGMQPLEFREGDFVKGIGDITYLGTILQNGSVAREFLGSNADSDSTPLDTDVSQINWAPRNIGQAIEETSASDYGPIYFVLKNDERFVITRDNEGYTHKGNLNKLEAFYTGYLGDDHYGIRTGFASSDIDYIVVQDYDERLGLEIAINGFYIPVSDFNGKIVFTPQDYDKQRSKMQGLSYLGSDNYQVSPYLNLPQVEEILKSQKENQKLETEKLANIENIIKEALAKANLKLKIGYDGNLEEGIVELLNTGSTARGTNLPNSADYDYIMRIDNTIIKDRANLEKFLENLCHNIKAQYFHIDDNKLRFYGLKLANGERVDIDLSYMPKLDKLEYSTERALEDRLKTIKKINAPSYDYVLANILLAKKILKENGVYKPHHSPECQNGLGGLGGVGIENWILQNNGSFFEALNSFLQVAQDKDFKEFCQEYFIWDFGENHYALKANDLDSYSYRYPHDDFVAQNMNEAGYNQMKKVLASCQRQYVTYLLQNLDHNYLSNNIPKDVYIASLEKLKNDVGNLALQKEITKHLDQVCQDTQEEGKHY